jgi:hypothetical protein
MRITFYGDVYAVHKDTAGIMPIPPAGNCWRFASEPLSRYLDPSLADFGITGGEVRAAVGVNGVTQLIIDYWAPFRPDEEHLGALALKQA